MDDLISAVTAYAVMGGFDGGSESSSSNSDSDPDACNCRNKPTKHVYGERNWQAEAKYGYKLM
jgi:hypothetical protein